MRSQKTYTVYSPFENDLVVPLNLLLNEINQCLVETSPFLFCHLPMISVSVNLVISRCYARRYCGLLPFSFPPEEDQEN